METKSIGETFSIKPYQFVGKAHLVPSLFHIIFVESGEGNFFFGKDVYPLKQNSFFIYEDKENNWIESTNLSMIAISAQDGFIPKWLAKSLLENHHKTVCQLPLSQANQIQHIIDIITEEAASGASNSADVLSLLTQTLIYYYLRHCDVLVDNSNDSIGPKIMAYLKKDKRFTEKITLQQISDYVGYSKFYTSATFHKQCGMSIQDYIISLRVNYAKQLLEESNYSATDIIGECGFTTNSNFYQQFIKITGMSPLKYKKSLQEKK